MSSVRMYDEILFKIVSHAIIHDYQKIEQLCLVRAMCHKRIFFQDLTVIVVEFIFKMNSCSICYEIIKRTHLNFLAEVLCIWFCFYVFLSLCFWFVADNCVSRAEIILKHVSVICTTVQ